VKTNKWLSWTIAILLSVIALGAVGFTTFRMGYMRGTVATQKALQSQTTKDGKVTTPAQQFPFMGPMHGFLGDSGRTDRGFNGQRDARNPNGFGPRGRGGFFPPLFGLFHFAVLVLLVWIGYMLFKKSGWQFVRVAVPAEPMVEAKVEKKKK